MSIKVILY